MAELVARSPLDVFREELAAVRSSDGVAIAALPLRGQLDLRAGDPGSVARLSGVLGVAFPGQPNRVARGDSVSVMWLGPDEWLVFCAPDAAARLETRLRAALDDGGWGAVVDVSSNRVGLSVSGPLARDVLATWCTLDLRPHRFAVDDCAQTLMGRTSVLLHRRDEDSFDLWVRPSFARHLARLLLDACEPWAP